MNPKETVLLLNRFKDMSIYSLKLEKIEYDCPGKNLMTFPWEILDSLTLDSLCCRLSLTRKLSPQTGAI